MNLFSLGSVSDSVAAVYDRRKGFLLQLPSALIERRHKLSRRLGLFLVTLLSVLTSHDGRAQTGNDNRPGPSGIFNGNIITVGNYDPYTANIQRDTIVDISVAGAMGTQPLAFVRTYNSRNPNTNSASFGWVVGAITTSGTPAPEFRWCNILSPPATFSLTTVKAVCAAHNIGEQTYYGWKRKYGAMEVNEARRLRGLEEECGRLKRLVAELSIQNQILKEVNAKKW